MAEPTARKALLSLAAHFDSLADGMRTDDFRYCYRACARSAREWARHDGQPPWESPAGNREGADGESRSVDLSAARERLLAAADTALDGLPVQPENRFERARWRIASHFVLDAVEPLIRADERANLRALLPYHVPCCPDFAASVADLLNDHGDSP